MKYGFIGLGNMGYAIIKGMRKSSFSTDVIYGHDVLEEKCRQAAELNVEIVQTAELVSKADVIVLAVKPQYMDEVLEIIQNHPVTDKLFISIAAGLPISYFQEKLPQNKIIRVMPNLNATYREAISAVCAPDTISEDDIVIAKNIFASVGTVIEIKESLLPAFSAVAGASPAFTFMYADA